MTKTGQVMISRLYQGQERCSQGGSSHLHAGASGPIPSSDVLPNSMLGVDLELLSTTGMLSTL